MSRTSAYTGSRQIVLFVPGFPESEEDSTCIPALQNFSLALARLRPDLQVRVITFQHPPCRGTYRWNGIEVYSAGGRNARGALRLLTWARVASRFFRIHRRAETVALHSFWLEECTLVAQLLARLAGIRHVASIMGQDAKAENRYLRRIDLRLPTITCGSAFAGRRFESATGRPPDRIVPFGLDTHSFAGREPRPRSIDVLGVGSLTPLKRYDLFVELVARLSIDIPSLRAVIIGEGPERPALERRIAAHGLTRILELRGSLPRPQVIDAMFQSKILLHPSSYEGQGYVFLEALRSGMRVVSFDVGYVPQGPMASACRDEAEMLERLEQHLKCHESHPTPPVESIDDTVGEFGRLYEADVGNPSAPHPDYVV